MKPQDSRRLGHRMAKARGDKLRRDLAAMDRRAAAIDAKAAPAQLQRPSPPLDAREAT